MNKDKFIEKLVAQVIDVEKISYMLDRYGLLRNALSVDTPLNEGDVSTAVFETTISDISLSELDTLPTRIFEVIVEEEDKILLDILNKQTKNTNYITQETGNLSVHTFETPTYLVEKNGLIVDNFLINGHEWSDIFSYMKNHVDPVTERELLLDGYFGNLFGARITAEANVKPSVIPRGTFYTVAAPEYLGTLEIPKLSIQYDAQEDSIKILGRIVTSINENAVAKTIRVDTVEEETDE